MINSFGRKKWMRESIIHFLRMLFSEVVNRISCELRFELSCA
jgi:hypothetical protein